MDTTEWLRLLWSGTGGGKLNGNRVASDSVYKGYLIFMGELGGLLWSKRPKNYKIENCKNVNTILYLILMYWYHRTILTACLVGT